jgi:hypothetical protein
LYTPKLVSNNKITTTDIPNVKLGLSVRCGMIGSLQDNSHVPGKKYTGGQDKKVI